MCNSSSVPSEPAQLEPEHDVFQVPKEVQDENERVKGVIEDGVAEGDSEDVVLVH